MTRSWRLAVAALALASGLAGLSAMDGQGLKRYRARQAEIEALQQKQRALQTENEALRRETAALAGDNRALERAAREDLGLVRSCEVVFTFER